MDSLKGQMIELDGEKYYIIDVLILHDEKYFYIANKDTPPTFKFVHVKDDGLFFVDDGILEKELLLLVAKTQ